MPITCPLRARLLRNLCETYYVHVIGPLRAYYVTHVTRYLNPPRNGFYYVHVIELVYDRGIGAKISVSISSSRFLRLENLL